MFRAVILSSLILTAAAPSIVLADTLAERVHSAAVTACAVESSASLPASHYAAITAACVNRISATALRKMQMAAEARTKASTAALN